MFKNLIKKLEEENLASNGVALRDTLRDAGTAVMKQVKEKIQDVASGSASEVSSSATSRTPSLIDFAPDGLSATPVLESPGDAHLIQTLQQEVTSVKKERDSLLLRYNQLCNLIEELKREVHAERILRKTLEEEYKKRSDDISFKVLVEKDVQTDEDTSIADRRASERERDTFMMRNAELSNLLEQTKKKLSDSESDRRDFESQVRQLKDELEDKQREVNRLREENQMISSDKTANGPNEDSIPLTQHQQIVSQLEDTITEKNKTIKLQQQRITDIKKSIQRGDFPGTSSSPNNGSNDTDVAGAMKSPPATISVASATMPGPSSQTVNTTKDNGVPHLDSHAVMTLSVNFEYLKNVVFKFITSSDVESQKQLVKAISTLLQFDASEETAVRETLEWRNSWMASIPIVGSNLKSSHGHHQPHHPPHHSTSSSSSSAHRSRRPKS